MGIYLLGLCSGLRDYVLFTPFITDRLAARFYPCCSFDVAHSVT